jgi:predicted DCC family thiol-disulfide oxidoreductase YuxK
MASADVSTPPAGTLATLSQGPVLLFDGECGVCAASVQWVLAHERTADLRFAALQSPVGRTFLVASGLNPEIDSLIWIEASGSSARIHYYADAVRAVLRYVDGPWTVLHTLLGLVPRKVRDFGYRWFARHRQSVAARQCLIPTPAQKARFFEQSPNSGLG